MKLLQSFLSLGQNWCHQKSKGQIWPKSFFDDVFVLKDRQRLWRYRVCLVKARWTMYNLTLKGQGQNLTSGQVSARSLGDPSRSQIIHHSMRLAETKAMTPISRLYLIWFSSYWEKTVSDLEWPRWPSNGSPTKNFTGSINKCVTWCDSIHISSRWGIKQGV